MKKVMVQFTCEVGTYSIRNMGGSNVGMVALTEDEHKFITKATKKYLRAQAMISKKVGEQCVKHDKHITSHNTFMSRVEKEEVLCKMREADYLNLQLAEDAYKRFKKGVSDGRYNIILDKNKVARN